MVPPLSEDTQLRQLRSQCYIAADGFLLWNSLICTVLLTTSAAFRLVRQKYEEFKAWVSAAEERLIEMVSELHGVEQFVRLWFAAFDKGRVPTYLSVQSTVITLGQQRVFPRLVSRISPVLETISECPSRSGQDSLSNVTDEPQQEQERGPILPHQAGETPGRPPTYDVRTWIQQQDQSRPEGQTQFQNPHSNDTARPQVSVTSTLAASHSVVPAASANPVSISVTAGLAANTTTSLSTQAQTHYPVHLPSRPSYAPSGLELYVPPPAPSNLGLPPLSAPGAHTRHLNIQQAHAASPGYMFVPATPTATHMATPSVIGPLPLQIQMQHQHQQQQYQQHQHRRHLSAGGMRDSNTNRAGMHQRGQHGGMAPGAARFANGQQRHGR